MLANSSMLCLQWRRAASSFEAAVKAIMTTDIFPKGSFRTVDLGDATMRICLS
jgi:N-acetylglutamate synthase/N-acetylornithine aminotransferase